VASSPQRLGGTSVVRLSKTNCFLLYVCASISPSSTATAPLLSAAGKRLFSSSTRRAPSDRKRPTIAGNAGYRNTVLNIATQLQKITARFRTVAQRDIRSNISTLSFLYTDKIKTTSLHSGLTTRHGKHPLNMFV